MIGEKMIHISAKTNYACRALLELSVHWPNVEPLQIEVIAQKQEIPIKFLTQILIILKQFGYVRSVRGKKGGYLLETPPSEIALSTVVKNVGSRESSNEFVNSQDIFENIWKDLNALVLKKLDKINFETLANQQRKSRDAVMFEI